MTGKDFQIVFNSVYGFLETIVISCQGAQVQDANIIWVRMLRNVNGTLKRRNITVYYGEQDGIRIEAKY